MGIWEADRETLGVFVPPELLTIITSLTFDGTVTGKVTMDGAGKYLADYITTSRVAVTLGGFPPLNLEIADTVSIEGTYRVDGVNLIVTASAAPGVADTVGFTVSGDSLKLIAVVPLGEYAALLPQGSSSPIGVITLRKIGTPDSGTGGGLTADFDGSGRVDFPDFIQFAQAFGKRGGEAGFDVKFDLDGNGDVGFPDFLEFARQFGLGE